MGISISSTWCRIVFVWEWRFIDFSSDVTFLFFSFWFVRQERTFPELNNMRIWIPEETLEWKVLQLTLAMRLWSFSSPYLLALRWLQQGRTYPWPFVCEWKCIGKLMDFICSASRLGNFCFIQSIAHQLPVRRDATLYLEPSILCVQSSSNETCLLSSQSGT